MSAASHNATVPALTVGQQISYSLPVMGMIFLFSSTMSVIQGVYATYYGLGLAAIATVLLVARLFDAVTDPMVGLFSIVFILHTPITRRRYAIICKALARRTDNLALGQLA